MYVTTELRADKKNSCLDRRPDCVHRTGLDAEVRPDEGLLRSAVTALRVCAYPSASVRVGCWFVIWTFENWEMVRNECTLKRSSWFICHLLNKGGDFFMTRNVQPLSSAFTTMQLCCIHLHGYQCVIYIIQLRWNDFFWGGECKI